MTVLKNIILVFFLLLCQLIYGQSIKLINPTGTYKTNFKNLDSKNFPQGIIKIKLIKEKKILISLYYQNGSPGFRSGSFLDTLNYMKNYAEFKNAEIDSTCKITLLFTSKGIRIKMFSKFENMQCGFADGVNADGFYYKISSKIPSFENPF